MNAIPPFEGDAAHYMINEEVESGRAAMGLTSTDNFEIGGALDALVIDAKSPLISTTSLGNLAAAIVYSSDTNYFLGTIINGRWVVRRNKHNNDHVIRSNFANALRQINIR